MSVFNLFLINTMSFVIDYKQDPLKGIDDEGLLPTRGWELLDLIGHEEGGVSSAGLEEVSTLSPRSSHSKEVSPLFLLPGTRPAHFAQIVSRLIYPAFTANLPNKIDDIDAVASTLAKVIIKIR